MTAGRVVVAAAVLLLGGCAGDRGSGAAQSEPVIFERVSEKHDYRRQTDGSLADAPEPR